MFCVDKGYVEAEIEKEIDIVEEINKLKKEKNAIILAHYYQREEIQKIADRIGDSLALAQYAATVDADIIVMCGVQFMAETAAILCPDKKVICPDTSAGCSLADSCNAIDFKKFLEKYPDHTVISYVNTSAEVKALTDIVVTSGNAKQIVNTLPADAKIVFGPDRNLGQYINSITGRNMVLWDGACHVHEQFSLEKLLKLKEENKGAKILVHPECKKPLVMVADKVGSTKALLDYALKSDSDTFIVATESGILYEMQSKAPNKKFIPVPPEDGECSCNECNFMKLNTLEKLYLSLKYEKPVVKVEKQIAEKAIKPIEKMLEISRSLGLV